MIWWDRFRAGLAYLRFTLSQARRRKRGERP
jgi:hypothetical protein